MVLFQHFYSFSCVENMSNTPETSSVESGDNPEALADGPDFPSPVVGTSSTLQQFQNEKRPKPRNSFIEPNRGWSHLPLSDWIPESNREIMLVFFAYNVALVFLARYAGLCGEPKDDNADSKNVFCSEDFVLTEDRVLTGLTVGMFLLLAFRANQAYDRFWEGRRAWSRLRDISRDFARFICAHTRVENDDDAADRRRAVSFITCFAIATKLHLRNERDINRDFKALGMDICPQDVANISKADNMPIFCQDVLSYYLEDQTQKKNLAELSLSDINAVCVGPMSDSLGTCERIANTPIPLSYVLQLRVLLMLWLLLFPLHIVAFYGWWTIPLACLISFAVLGIEAMSSEIEHPFGYDRNDLNLCEFTREIYEDTQATLLRAESPHRAFLYNRRKVVGISKARIESKFLKKEDFSSAFLSGPLSMGPVIEEDTVDQIAVQDKV